MNLSELFRNLVAQVLDDQSSDLDGLLVIYLLHTHLVRLRKGVVLDDARCGDLLGSLTKAHAAGLVGARFSTETRRHNMEFWLREYALRTPYEFHDELPVALRERVAALRLKAAEHPLVLELVPGEG